MITNKTATLFAMPLAEAMQHIKDYRDMMHDHFKQHRRNILKGYLIHSEELLEAMGITNVTPKYPLVRVYIGKIKGDKTVDMKLFITPVDENGKDVILYGPTDETGTEGPYVLDLNAPCPNACDPSSPLFQA